MSGASPHTPIIDLLARWGVDAHTILEKDWTPEGYWAIQFNPGAERSVRIICDGEFVKAWHDWPPGFPVDELYRLTSRRPRR